VSNPGAPYTALRALLADAGYVFVEPPIVFEAAVFVELAGEDLRRRLFLTNSAEGTELALRPDYTIPVCLRHLATGEAKRKASYAYLGPVFRQRPGETGEFLQAGVESLGRTDRVAADADILKLAIEAADLLGVRKAAIRIGDSAVFAAVLAALDLNAPWRKRLARAFGDSERLKGLIARANGKAKPLADDRGDGFDDADRVAARKHVEALFASTGQRTIGGRTADEIVNRYVEKAALSAGIGDRPAKVLWRFLGVFGPPSEALGALRALARQERIDIGKTLDRFEKRVEALVRHEIELSRLTFAADFGRRLDYYTGFVFEIHDPRRPGAGQIVGGGRYDRLMSLLPGSSPGNAVDAVPAIGFAIWLDRVATASPASAPTRRKAGGAP
jgi:ATP phosphoribosyltransferase regulatory subunit